MAGPDKSEVPSIEEQRRFWNEWNAKYREGAFSDAISMRRADAALALLQSLNLRDPQILELGCSSGWMSELLAEFGHVTAVDIADEVIARAKTRRSDISYIASDIMTVDLPAGRFDVVISLQTLREITDAAGFIQKAARWLRTDGYLILTTHNEFVLRRMDIRPKYAGQVRNWIDQRSLKHLLARYFVIQRFATIGPDGHHGVLRLVNSYKLNAAWTRFFSQRSLDAIKERAGLGRTIVILGRKRRVSAAKSLELAEGASGQSRGFASYVRPRGSRSVGDAD